MKVGEMFSSSEMLLSLLLVMLLLGMGSSVMLLAFAAIIADYQVDYSKEEGRLLICKLIKRFPKARIKSWKLLEVVKEGAATISRLRSSSPIKEFLTLLQPTSVIVQQIFNFALF